MPILRDIPMNLTAEDVLAGQSQRPIASAFLHNAERAIASGQTLWQPVAAYDWFDVHAHDGENIHLTNTEESGRENVLRIGSGADLLAHARRVLVAVGTIGFALEQQVHELQQAGEGLKAYLLDSAGVVALDAVGEALRCLAEETAARQSWGVSAALAPGSLAGWSLQGQRDLCALLSLDSIGVRLNDHYVLEPYKSFSVVIGIGPGYGAQEVGSVCLYCALRNTCWRRRGKLA